MGEATNSEMNASLIKSPDNSFQISNMEDPSTFLIPISLIRWPAISVASPNIPKQEIEIVRTENTLANFPRRSSSPNFFEYSRSTNWKSNGSAGLYFSKVLF